MLGSKVKFLGIGNMRFFKNEKEMSDPESVKSHPLGIPMLITSEPSEIDVREVRLSKGGQPRKCVVLTFYKGDPLLVNTGVIKTTEAMMMTLSRLEQGKLDHLTPEVVVSIIHDCETMNGLSLRIPSEEMEIFVGERYRDPNSPRFKYRHHEGPIDPDTMVSHNMRTDAMQSTSFQGLTHEDVNNAVIAAVNRKDAGIIDEPTTMERLERGLDMEDLKQSDYNDKPPQEDK